MTGRVAALYRHPVKGFTPERLERAQLSVGLPFPCDRLYAVEDGPSGFDPAAPAHISKMRFAVLAKVAEVAKARTRYDEATAIFHAAADGRPDFAGDLAAESGRAAFASWLADLLGEAADGPLRVIAGEGHRFLDHPQGHVSIINLASVRELGERIGVALDPLRFRANIYVEGWPAWAENGWVGETLTLGDAEAQVFKPIVRCAATSVDPATAERDLDLPAALFAVYGHLFCGVYVKVAVDGEVRQGDPAGPAA